MGIKKTFENMVNRWLFKEEIEQHEQMVENGPTEAEIREEAERIKRIHDEQLAIIKAEDHSQPPSEEDIKRYLNYHTNMVENIKMIKESTGQEPPFTVPEKPLTEDEYRVMVNKDGWRGMRMSCGLPTGDLSKPRQPWVAPSKPASPWKTEEDPEIHWKKD